MSEQGGERTEPATPKRLAEARRKGDLPDIRDLSTAAVVLAGAIWIGMAGRAIWDAMAKALRIGLATDFDPLRGFRPVEAAIPMLTVIAVPLAILFALTWIAALASRAIGGGLGANWEAALPKLQRIDPMAGVKRMFSMRGVIDFAKSLAKLALLVAATWVVMSGSMPVIMTLGLGDPVAASGAAAIILVQVVAAITVALIVIAIIDMPIQIMLRSKRLMMSRQQVRDEHRESEHSPEMRQRLHAKRSALLDQSARKAIKEATVVLVNPTSFAVALRYRIGEDAAPVVVARARAEAAAALRELAQAEDVPILTYPVLARAIYFTSRSGQCVDEKLYRAVATVLAFVFSLDAAIAARRTQPEIEVPEGLRYGADGRRSV